MQGQSLLFVLQARNAHWQFSSQSRGLQSITLGPHGLCCEPNLGIQILQDLAVPRNVLSCLLFGGGVEGYDDFLLVLG